MRIDSYYELLKRIKKTYYFFLRSKDIYYLEAFGAGYFTGTYKLIVNYTNEEIKEKVADYFFNELMNEYCLLSLSKICDKEKLDKIYPMSINSYGYVERLIEQEKKFDTILDIEISLYELIFPLLDLENKNTTEVIKNTNVENLIIDGKLINNIKQLNDYINSTKDKEHFIDYPYSKKASFDIFTIFSHICYYNQLKKNGINLIIENEKDFLKENEKEKKVFYALINTYKNIVDNKELFIHPNYIVYHDKININLVIKK